MQPKLITLAALLLFTAAQAFAQLPIRNLIYNTESQVSERWDTEGFYYEAVPDYYNEEGGDQFVTVTVYGDAEMTWESNQAYFYLRNDSCYQIQYSFYEDPFVISNLRSVIQKRQDFKPCDDLKDCWIQSMPNDTTSYYWNLFEVYEGSEDTKALIIEPGVEFVNNK
ncbi:MAG: hypothetical protein KDC44_00860, partial [Phaeodactylibacter sp.]|nr:hypothetical protein [Phaeodactylibacter sp.]